MYCVLENKTLSQIPWANLKKKAISATIGSITVILEEPEQLEPNKPLPAFLRKPNLDNLAKDLKNVDLRKAYERLCCFPCLDLTFFLLFYIFFLFTQVESGRAKAQVDRRAA